MPKEIKIKTDNGTGTILPSEKYKVLVEYRPSANAVFDESAIHVRVITGKACVRELKLPFQCNVLKCPIQSDKQKIELPCLPEDEFSEVVLELKNSS